VKVIDPKVVSDSPAGRQVYDPSVTDPFAVAAPFLDGPPQWLILGGLGNTPDVHRARERWPDVKVVGVDPDPRAVAWQKEHGWPGDAPLLEAALAATDARRLMNLSDLCCASLHDAMVKSVKEGDLVGVDCVTLDALDRQRGPFEDCILWLDLEGFEWSALVGGKDLLASGRVYLLNVEVHYEWEFESRWVNRTLTANGYRRVYVHGRQWWGHDEIWLKKS